MFHPSPENRYSGSKRFIDSSVQHLVELIGEYPLKFISNIDVDLVQYDRYMGNFFHQITEDDHECWNQL